MTKYLIMWEEDMSKMPTGPAKQAALIRKQIEMTKKSLDEGQISDWGVFAGGNAGYAISEGTAKDAFSGVMQFSPYIKFKVLPALSLDEVYDGITEISKS